MPPKQASSPSLLNGVILVASGAIGAGMFAIPVVSAGMWLGWTIVSLCFIWLLNLIAVLLLVESNLRFPAGASFHTIVGKSLGPIWNLLNNLAIVFVMYILLYAYFSASGSIVAQTYSQLIASESPIPQNAGALLFGLIVAILVWSGTNTVSRICGVLLLAMVTTFLLSSSGLLLSMQLTNLTQANASGSAVDDQLASYIWAALPYFVTSFACAGLVPSLVKYYGHKPVLIKQSFIYGTLISLAIYLLWVIVAFGNLSRAEFTPVLQAGGNMGQLLAALQQKTGQQQLSLVLNLFANFAITTSFLSIGLGLFDYIADRFKFDSNGLGRSKTALLTFLPPAVLSFFYPNGFILAIGYAGLVVIFSFFIVPVVMAWQNRQTHKDFDYRVIGGTPMLATLLLLSLVIALLKLLGSFGLLATFG